MAYLAAALMIGIYVAGGVFLIIHGHQWFGLMLFVLATIRGRVEGGMTQ